MLDESKYIIKAQNIVKSFKDGDKRNIILDKVDLKIKKGDTIALLGDSGVGKSSFLQILGLIDAPDSGDLFIANNKVKWNNYNQLTRYRREHLGFVFQFHYLFPEFSVIENVKFPLLLKGVSEDKAHYISKDIIDRMDLKNRYDSKPAELSGGERQRIAIARAAVTKPKLLLADEPTGNLDLYNSKKIISLMLEYSKEVGQTILMVTHNYSLAKFMDKMIAIENKKIKNI